MVLKNENELYATILCGHMRTMVRELRLLPDDKWDWSPSQTSPTPRILAAHAWQWHVCDRQHIAEPDALKHQRVPDAPQLPEAMCAALSAETDRWEELILALTPEQLDAPRSQFNHIREANTRWFIGHMIQNAIYKHGQFAELFFALGLDGEEPYSAPFPNPIYESLQKGEI